ncbi:MAG: FixH family protein [Alphaproteobacteria bacterium]|nr:FixH family protein [Alphaproteobacteria bacterium]
MSEFVPGRMRYVPWLFVAGFAVVIAVNGIMVWFAVGSFSGLYADHARERGVHYNTIVAEQRERDAVGWLVDASWRADQGKLQLALRRADGTALGGAAVSAELVRPAEKRAPLAVAFSDIGEGRFVAAVALPAHGNWDLDLEITADGHRFGYTRRMFLK